MLVVTEYICMPNMYRRRCRCYRYSCWEVYDV